MTPEITIEALGSGDRAAMLDLDQSAFAFDGRDLDPEAETTRIEWDRSWAARRDGRLGGIYVVFSFGLTVPARAQTLATISPVAGLSWVAVHPDHRRRGVLSAMIRHHFDDIHEGGRGEAVSCLFASEPAIYGRFGYGLSTESVCLTLPSRSALRALPEPGDVSTCFEAVDQARHGEIVRAVYAASCLQRPGHTLRPASHLDRQLEDLPARRPAGAESLKILVAERRGEPTGYALLRRTASWGKVSPEGSLRVVDLHATDPASAHALWRRALDFDLMAEVSTPPLAMDDPLLVWAGESRAAAHPGYRLWTRLIDVGPALAARGYSTDLEVILDVSDEMCPWNAGRWQLTADSRGATCERTACSADVALDVRELGSAYLGGTTLAGLAAAGLVRELTPGALVACSTAWRSPVLPATPYMF